MADLENNMQLGINIVSLYNYTACPGRYHSNIDITHNDRKPGCCSLRDEKQKSDLV